jgi:VWFA-related protein
MMKLKATIALLSAVAVSVAVGQTPTAVSDGPAYRLKVESNLVLVPVVVEGKGDNLSREEFAVSENGAKQKIAVFIPPGKTVTADTGATTPGYVSVAQSIPQANSLNIILLDGLNTSLHDQQALRQALLAQIDSIDGSKAQTAVYYLTSRLTVLQPFTPDPGLLRAALGRMGGAVPRNVDERDSGTDVERALSPIPLSDSSHYAVKNAEFAERQFQIRNRIEETVAALQSIARSTAVFPGRKNLIWISSSFPMALHPESRTSSVFQGTNSYGVNQGPAGEYVDYELLVRKAVNALNNAEIAVYAVDATRLPTAGLTGSLDEPARTVAKQGRALTDSFSREATDRQDSQSTLMHFAEQTGGRYFLNANDPSSALRRAQDDAGHTYLLGYYVPKIPETGRFHSIKVAVSRPGYSLHYRKGYTTAQPESSKAASDLAIRDAITSILPSTEMMFRAHFTAQGGKPQVEFFVDQNSIDFEAMDKDRHRCELDFVVALLTPAGEIQHLDQNFVKAELTPQRYADVVKAGLGYRLDIQKPERGMRVRILVHDRRSGRFGRIDAAL